MSSIPSTIYRQIEAAHEREAEQAQTIKRLRARVAVLEAANARLARAHTEALHHVALAEWSPIPEPQDGPTDADLRRIEAQETGRVARGEGDVLALDPCGEAK